MTQMSRVELEPNQINAQLYEEKTVLALSRIAKRQTLQRKLAEKQAKNAMSRYQFEAKLERDKRQEINSKCEEKVDSSHDHTQQVLTNFRKVTLLYFLSNREEIIDKIRREFVINRNLQKPSVKQILEFIMTDAINECLGCLSPLDKEILYTQIDYSFQTSADLFKLAAIYPLENQRLINLYVLEDMKAFYGQIIGVLSGIGLVEWSNGQQDEKKIQEELNHLPKSVSILPNPISLEPLLEDLRIFLIAQTMRLKTQAIIDQKKDQPHQSEAKLCEKLLAKYSSNGGKPETMETLNEFDHLPSISDGIGRIIGIFTRTKEKYFTQFEQRHRPSDLVKKVYAILKLIADLSDYQSQENIRDPQFPKELARILAEDFGQAMDLLKTGDTTKAEMILDRTISVGTRFRSNLIK